MRSRQAPSASGGKSSSGSVVSGMRSASRPAWSTHLYLAVGLGIAEPAQVLLHVFEAGAPPRPRAPARPWAGRASLRPGRSGCPSPPRPRPARRRPPLPARRGASSAPHPPDPVEHEDELAGDVERQVPVPPQDLEGLVAERPEVGRVCAQVSAIGHRDLGDRALAAGSGAAARSPPRAGWRSRRRGTG